MNYTQLLEKVKQYVLGFFTLHPDEKIFYHNLEHTEDVVRAASLLTAYYKLDDEDSFAVLCAAWFHDIGYYNGAADAHEQRGAEQAEEFLRNNKVSELLIAKVRGCIQATRMPQSPHSLIEQIVCDADLSHLGTESFNKRNKLLRKEVEAREGRQISKEAWRLSSIRFLEEYQYHTDYAKQLYNKTKTANAEVLKQKVFDKNETGEKGIDVSGTSQEPGKPEITKKRQDNRPDRGIETMFRVSSSNHQRLSDMADNKAHIMITTTSIIISVLLSVLIRKLEDNAYLIFPTTLLLAVCVITLVFCILATRPSVPSGVFTNEDIESKKVNLLFFGNFYKMSFDDYLKGMKKMMNDREFLYDSLTRDVYSQGIVLGHKYRLLRTGYNIFMYGIVASVIAFVIATVFFS
jgi:predicted metal-dependent HD superfamily phosphohydrolase